MAVSSLTVSVAIRVHIPCNTQLTLLQARFALMRVALTVVVVRRQLNPGGEVVAFI